MKLLQLTLISLFPCFLMAQSNLCDSIFVKARTDFKSAFLIGDSIDVLTKKQIKEDLKVLDNQLSCNLFYKANPLRGIRHSSDAKNHVDFGMFEFEFSSLAETKKAFQYLRKKPFYDTSGEFDIVSCSKMDKTKIIFIYSSSVKNDKMRKFFKEICTENIP